MSRLIDAEVLKRKLLREWVRNVNEVNRFVDSLPSYSRPERIRGRWIDGYKRQTCSLCKGSGFRSWRFCPYCGADMREEDSNG